MAVRPSLSAMRKLIFLCNRDSVIPLPFNWRRRSCGHFPEQAGEPLQCLFLELEELRRSAGAAHPSFALIPPSIRLACQYLGWLGQEERGRFARKDSSLPETLGQVGM